MSSEAQRIAADICPDADSDETTKPARELATEIANYWADDFGLVGGLLIAVIDEVELRILGFRKS